MPTLLLVDRRIGCHWTKSTIVGYACVSTSSPGSSRPGPIRMVLYEETASPKSRLGSSRAVHYVYDPDECWNGYYPLQYFPQDFFCDTGMTFFFFSHFASSLPVSFPLHVRSFVIFASFLPRYKEE